VSLGGAMCGGSVTRGGGFGFDCLFSSTGATEASHQRGFGLASGGGNWATTVEHFDYDVLV